MAKPRFQSPVPTIEQGTELPIDDGLGDGENAGLLIPLDLNDEYPDGSRPVDYATGNAADFEPPESRMKFPPLHPPEDAPEPAPAPGAAVPAQKPVVQWSEIAAHPQFGELDTENKLTALDKWAAFVRGKIAGVDDPESASAALDKYVASQGALISPTYATAKELKDQMQAENRAGGFQFFLGPLPDDQVARLASPMNGSQLSLARTGTPDIWNDLNQKRAAEATFAEMRKELVAKAGDEELADLIIEREREQRRTQDQLPVAQQAAAAIMDKIDASKDPEEQAALQKQYSVASRTVADLQRNLGNYTEVHADDRRKAEKPARGGRLGELDAQIAARSDVVAHANNGVSPDQSALGALAMTWGKNSTNFLEHSFIGKAMTKGTDLMMQLAGAPAGSAQGAASDLGATMDEVLAGRIPEGMSKALMNPALHDTVQEQIARGVGSLLDPKTPSLFIGGWPGITVFGLMAGQQDYSATEAHTLSTGGTEEQARKDGLTAAAWTLPTLVAYGVAGKVIGGAAGKLLPATATPLARAAIQLPANTFANMTASAALRVARGEDFIPENFIEHAAPDVLFALHGATDGYKNATEIQRLRPTMEAMAAGTHPDAVLRKAIIDSPVFDDGAKKLASAELAAFQRGAREFLSNIGAPVPEDTGMIDTPERGEAYQKMLDLAQERQDLMRAMNDPAAPPPEGSVQRLSELQTEMGDLIKSPALAGKPEAAEESEPAPASIGASTEVPPKRAAHQAPEPAPEPPAIATEHALAIHDAQADLDWAVGSGDAGEIEAARAALDAAKARAAKPAEPGQPAPTEPVGAPKGLQGGYDALVKQTGFPAVSIAGLAQESGIPLEDLKGQLTKLHAEGKVVLSVGDWSLSDEATRAGALDVPGQPRNLQVRFLEEAPTAPSALPAPAPVEYFHSTKSSAPVTKLKAGEMTGNTSDLRGHIEAAYATHDSSIAGAYAATGGGRIVKLSLPDAIILREGTPEFSAIKKAASETVPAGDDLTVRRAAAIAKAAKEAGYDAVDFKDQGNLGVVIVRPERFNVTDPLAKPKVRGGFRLPYAPLGTPDIIDFVMEQGGIRLPSKERRGQEYDDAPEFRGVYRRLLTTSGAVDADEMAQMMHESGLLRDGDVNTMWAELHKAAESRQRVRKQQAIQEAQQRDAGRAASRQEKAFDKDAGPESGEWPVEVDTLKIGDVVEVGGEKLKVTDIDSENGDVTLGDGKKYGIQIVGKDEVIYGEHVPAPRPAGDPFSGELVSGDATKTPEQLAAEQAKADAAALKLQQQQDARVGAAKPLRAGEDIRPERDMFGADAAEGDDLFDRKPSAPAAEPVPAAELPAAEPAPEPAAPVETKPSATVERELTAEQQLALSKTAEGLANGFEWRNDAEKDSAIAEVQTKLEKQARTFLQGTGSLDGFSAAVVARSRFRDILKRSEAKKVSNPEPKLGDEGGELPDWTASTEGTIDEAPDPSQAAARAEAMAKVNEALGRLSDKGELADDKRKIVELFSNGDDLTTIATALDWNVGQHGRADVTRVQRALTRIFDEILRDTKLKRSDVVGLYLLPPGFIAMIDSVTGPMLTAVPAMWRSMVDLKHFDDFRRSLLNWSMTQQRSSNEVFNMLHFMEREVPRAVTREGITNWIQAAGDRATLETRRNATTNRALRAGYQAALDLTPDQVRIAQHIGGVYDRLLQRGRAYGLLTNGLQDYVNQIWQQPNALASALRLSSARKLNEYFRFNRERIHDSFFDGEQSGLKPVTKDISKLLAIYLNEMNNAIASRRLVLDLRRGRASDGRPLISPSSRTNTIDNAGGRTVLVYPDRLPQNIHDYKDIPDQPALHSWVWSAVDAAGNPTLVDADLVLHPEIHDHMRKVLTGSRLRNWWQSESRDPLQAIPKAAAKFLLEDVQSIAKQTMLGFFSPFHAVQEGTHALFHRVNPFYNLPQIDLTRSAAQRDAAAHGLMLMPDRVSKAVFMEGLGATDRNLVVNIIRRAFGVPGRIVARFADDFQQWLFHSYIPALKYKTYEHILERNRQRYQEEFASGAASDDQVKYLSALQSNAAYGHLNYADMGRSANWMHLSSSMLLAPDFLEARGRFTGQAIKGALGAKSGREQLAAMMFGAAGLWMGARILNKIGDDDWHWDQGFDIIHGNRRYTIRSVPEDIVHAIVDTRKFVMGRVSPVVKLGIEATTGRNYRGEKVEGWEPFRDFVASIVPLTVQPFTRDMSDTSKNNPVTKGEQLMGALGLHVARYSPVTNIYPIANEWRKENAGKITGVTKPDNTSYPVSKYQQLRYALDDGDYERAAREFAKLQQAEGATVKVPAWKIRDGFKESLHHPFTGTEKTDRKFRESLAGKERQMFDAAAARRHLIWDRFVKMRQAATQKSPAPE